MSEALGRRSLVLIAGLIAACAPPATAPEGPVARLVRVDAPERDQAEPSDATPAAARTVERAAPLSREDCEAFGASPALALAVVIASNPDCSSVGHRRVVLEVQRLVRGAGIVHVGTSRSLFSREEPRLELGDTVLVAIEPEVQPAEIVYCVSLPERQGSVRTAVEVDSLAAAEPLLDAIAAGRCAD